MFHDAGAWNQTLGRDFIFPNIIAVLAAAHLDDSNHFAKLPFNVCIAKPDNVVGKK